LFALGRATPRRLFFSYQLAMPKNKIGPNRAIVQRAYRRGYAQAVADVIAAISGHVPQSLLGRIYQWQRRVKRWQAAMSAAADESHEHEPAPRPTID
jgi:hypothetical protein